MIVLGLTGSIGMGKSTTAELFREQGIAVFDADQSVHELYHSGAFEAVSARFPKAVRDGAIQRDILGRLVLNDPDAMADLERIIHPLVVSARTDFLRREQEKGSALVVVDIPLLFETKAWRDVDAVVVVSASFDEQRRRVLSRPTMNEEKFSAILHRQLPDAEKRRRSHFTIKSDDGIESARRQTHLLIASLRQTDR
ncbi:dephospho-CoA kinase [Rhodoblastus sp.]|jgi:dephospho-CoA kinase|uniref:dephospho-CoA kinase n=1 Tax=Rhodoblastus sp. TaxID=1962975 RepID=UPI0025E6452B|nr:dephospho-CoA kinase [Rhodoblastus sp.]